MSEENNNQENEDEFLRAALGDLENDPAHEAWIMMHEMYLSLQKGGLHPRRLLRSSSPTSSRS